MEVAENSVNVLTEVAFPAFCGNGPVLLQIHWAWREADGEARGESAGASNCPVPVPQPGQRRPDTWGAGWSWECFYCPNRMKWRSSVHSPGDNMLLSHLRLSHAAGTGPLCRPQDTLLLHGVDDMLIWLMF